jgi:hypothetical protein
LLSVGSIEARRYGAAPYFSLPRHSRQLHRRPRQPAGIAAHEQPRQRVCEQVGGRVLARFPERHQLIAVGHPVAAHLVRWRGGAGADGLSAAALAFDWPQYSKRKYDAAQRDAEHAGRGYVGRRTAAAPDVEINHGRLMRTIGEN